MWDGPGASNPCSGCFKGMLGKLCWMELGSQLCLQSSKREQQLWADDRTATRKAGRCISTALQQLTLR